jgi:hypothetical protein
MHQKTKNASLESDMHMQIIALVLLPLTFAGSGLFQEPSMLAASLALRLLGQDTVTARQAGHTISPEDIRRHVYVLADDSMRGRITPSPELEAAAHYVAAELQRANLRPPGDEDSYFQRYEINQVQLLPESTAVWTTGIQPMRWTYGVDYVPHPFNDFTDWTIQGSAMLLVGPVGGRVDFDTASLQGRVLLIPLTAAAGLGRNYGRIVSWHPAAVLRVQDVPDSIFSQLTSEAARAHARVPGSTVARLPMLVIRDRAAAALISRGGIDLAELRRTQTDTILRAIPLSDAVVHVRLRVRPVIHQNPANVIAILAGTDPVLRSEYVVYSAHMDHLGVGTPVSGDSIYNGADDNASGTAAVLAVAKAFARLAHPPRRSVMFVLFSGEEGLGWGSEFFLNQPPVPISAMVADLNADMVGRNWRDTLIVIGRRDSDMGQAVDRVLASFPELGLAVTDSSTRPNDAPTANLYWWSDHGAFIRRGIPFLYFYSGMHPDYHRPSDSADKIDAEKLARISRLMFYVGLEVANKDRRPQWDPDRYARLVSPR